MEVWIVGSAVAVVTAVILVLRYLRDRHTDPHIQWLVTGKLEPDGYEVALRPVGGTVRDVRINIGFIGGYIAHPPLARAEWPETEENTLSLTFDLKEVIDNPGNVWVLIIWRPTFRARHQFEEWFPVALDGEARKSWQRQTIRSPLKTWLLRVRGASVSPDPKGIGKRRLTARDVRREIRKRT